MNKIYNKGITREQLKEVFQKNNKELVWVARKLVGDFYCEDMVSDAYLKLFEVGIADGSNPGAFLKTVVKNNCLRFLRSKKYGNKERERVSQNEYQYKPLIPKEAILSEDMYSNDYADNLLIRAELINLISKKREQLPERRKDIFDLIYLHDLSYDEISAALGVSNFVVRKEKMIINKIFKIFGKDRWYRYVDRGATVFKLKPA